MGEKLKTQKEVVDRGNDIVLMAYKLIEKMDCNKGEMGILIKDKEFREGSVVTDDKGDVVIDVNTGEVKKYPDSYWVEFSNSSFGTYKMRVEKDIFEKVEVNERYILTYILETKEVITKSKSGYEYVNRILQIKPLNFEPLKNLRVYN